MAGRIRITVIRKDKPEVRLYVLALIALARQLQEEEARAGAGETPAPASPEGGAHE
jgi:hypothetical protein